MNSATGGRLFGAGRPTPRHVTATPEGDVTFTLAEDSGTVTLESARRVPSRWLARGRPRVVRFGTRRFCDGAVTIRLSPENLALLRRMRAIRAVLRVDDHAPRAVTLHAPVPRRSARRR